MVVITRLEKTRYHPGTIVFALDVLSRTARHPMRRLWDHDSGCGEFFCCPDPDTARTILHATAHALPARDARRLRRRIAEFDSLW